MNTLALALLIVAAIAEFAAVAKVGEQLTLVALGLAVAFLAALALVVHA